ncbi:hypothetical protein [Grimontia hollisae]|uniref:Uncharacterized protein n=2 Tax=Grimontia hollisae TaxID=673 RepID=D0I962_GRIHO|nr:hypothetical protein [Grimontia hollisae]EEY71977.1 hypothetical protein VHA_002399 [Grimontia hollisae CIP 101886]MDF2184616.1 hypothetical protein [Grimontia hollisae]STO77468.1 Uncharacterised protein [Grimontia hollisae]STO98487.1 Uncharacterised protein [Grimontia hollisae]STQ75685.1 Uncharacterised protein [Grimontia hollisae]
MKSAKEFAAWLMDRFDTHSNIWLTRRDITEITGRQALRSEFIHDVHCELINFSRGLIADIKNDRYYMVSLCGTYWKEVGDIYADTDKCVDPFPIDGHASVIRTLNIPKTT